MRLPVLAVAAAFAGAITLGTVAPATVATPGAAAATDSTPTVQGKDVIVQAFQWNWSSVAQQCTDVLGPAGYGAVQVSPPQEHVVLPEAGYPWWQDYQPVSYQLGSRRGDRTAFASMVKACHGAGVKVYVDAVINHMSGQNTESTGSAGSSYSHYDYPVYSYRDFHHCGRNGDDDIENYQDRWEVQHCELVNLADLDTGSSYVRNTIAGYLNDLISLGVDGFRIDGAKHIAAKDLAAITAKLSEQVYLFSEVIYGAGEPIKPDEYTGIGDVTEFRYSSSLSSIFQSGTLADLEGFGAPLESESAVVFVDNHDSQRKKDVLTYKDGQTYTLANAFMLGWNYGTPRVMSSYTFSGHDQGPPSDGAGRTSDVDCSSGAWQCEHKWQPIANMVGFHNTVQGTGVNNWWDNGNDAIAFGRGDQGYLALNAEDSAVRRSFQSNLAAGTYCDVLNGDFTNGTCTGRTVRVAADGSFTATIGPNQGLALHSGATLG